MKFGIDPQEDAIKAGAIIGSRIGSLAWGEEPESDLGHTETRRRKRKRIPTEPGDYRDYYANVRDAILGVAPIAVPGVDAWRTARIIELARQSSEEGQNPTRQLR